MALEGSSAKRKSFFDEFCGAEENPRREVKSLLNLEKQYDSIIDTSPESLFTEGFPKNRIPILSADKLTNTKFSRCSARVKWARFIWLRTLKFCAASSLSHPHILTIYDKKSRH